MRNLILVLPILALSACSITKQPYLNGNSDINNFSQYNQDTQACSSGVCADGQSYSVATGAHANGFHDEVHTQDWAEQKPVQNPVNQEFYVNQPAQVNAGGFGHPIYGSQQAPVVGFNDCQPQKASRYAQPALGGQNCGKF